MACVYVLAHFDDEYAAWPLVRARARQGIDQWFLYVADYATAARSQARCAESRAALGRLGVAPERIVHVGRGTGVLDGALHRGLPPALAALRAAIGQAGDVERLVAPAWEGGHMDHDMCALLATAMSAELGGAPVEQFSLYNGAGLVGPFFHAARPLAANGAMERIALGAGDWLSWMGDVRFYPSQATSWAGLWPMMFLSGLRQGGFVYQRLDPARLRERPHEGPLLYERMFKVAYGEVRAAADAFLNRAPDPA